MVSAVRADDFFFGFFFGEEGYEDGDGAGDDKPEEGPHEDGVIVGGAQNPAGEGIDPFDVDVGHDGEGTARDHGDTGGDGGESAPKSTQ